MDTDHLRRLFDAGATFREAFDAACHSDTAYAVEAFRQWCEFESGASKAPRWHDEDQPRGILALAPYPIGASDHAVCWLLRDEWAGLPPGVWCRDGRSSWLVPGTQTMENTR